MTSSTYDGVFNKFIFIISCSIILMNDVKTGQIICMGASLWVDEYVVTLYVEHT